VKGDAMDYVQTLRDWFEREGGAGLVLPDGWYGRPFDNVHTLVSVNHEANDLTIELERNLLLHFRGLRNLESRDHDLVFTDFDYLQFKWAGIGTPGGTKEYYGGEVRLIAISLAR
jgi:hypothetical protein